MLTGGCKGVSSLESGLKRTEDVLMKVIDMRVRIPREASKEEPADFTNYYQDRAGFDL